MRKWVDRLGIKHGFGIGSTFCSYFDTQNVFAVTQFSAIKCRRWIGHWGNWDYLPVNCSLWFLIYDFIFYRFYDLWFHEYATQIHLEFGYIVHILAAFGNRNTGGHGSFYFERYLTDIFKSYPLESPLLVDLLYVFVGQDIRI